MQGPLMQNFGDVQTQARMSNHGSKMVKVMMAPGQDLLAKSGSMIAYEGLIDFVPNPPRLQNIAKSWATGEGVSLMQCQGQGELFLADYGADCIVMQLSGDGLSVNGPNILAFDAGLSWDIKPIKGLGKLAGGGMFNVVVQGQGWIAITTRGTPIMLDCGQQPTYVDRDALVAWTTGLDIGLNKSVSLKPSRKALKQARSGEAAQLAFKGQGFVVVQPAEDPPGKLFSIKG